MIRFIHTADIHFGMENYGRVDPGTGIHSRLLDFFNALNFCVDVALEEDVDFFLFCGDAYKTAHPSQTQQKLLFQCFLRLYKAGIPIVIIIGNHDNPLTFGKAHALNLFSEIPCNGFYVFDTATRTVIETKSGPIQIVAIPWPTRATVSLATHHLAKTAHEITHYITAAVTSIIQSYASQLDTTLPALLAGHLTVGSGIFSGSEKRAIYGTDPIFLPSQLAIYPFDYVALGHLHRHQNLNPDNFPPLVYSGSIERIDFGERNEKKGFCLVTIHKKGNTEYRFIETPIRTFIQIDVQLNTYSSQTEQIINALQDKQLADAVLKIVYHMPLERKEIIDLNEIQRACSAAHHIAGIIPVYHQEQRRTRNDSSHMSGDLETVLTHYFSKKHNTDKAMELTRKALDLLATNAQENETSN
jgi:exonuclease SbcD